MKSAFILLSIALLMSVYAGVTKGIHTQRFSAGHEGLMLPAVNSVAEREAIKSPGEKDYPKKERTRYKLEKKDKPKAGNPYKRRRTRAYA